MLAPRLLEGLRVLVVEDNLLFAEVTRLALEESGCAVVGPAAGCSVASSWHGRRRSTARSSTSTCTAR